MFEFDLWTHSFDIFRYVIITNICVRDIEISAKEKEWIVEIDA